MQYVQALVHKNADMKIPVAVLPWEIKVLEMKYEQVEVLGRVEGDDRDIDPEAEYSRLQSKHGLSPDTRQPFVTMAYGQLHEGKLATAIDKCVAEQEVASDEEVAEAGPHPADLDGDGEVERDEIKAKLDELGVEYNNRAHTDTLKDLLDEVLAGAGSGDGA